MFLVFSQVIKAKTETREVVLLSLLLKAALTSACFFFNQASEKILECCEEQLLVLPSSEAHLPCLHCLCAMDTCEGCSRSTQFYCYRACLILCCRLLPDLPPWFGLAVGNLPQE